MGIKPQEFTANAGKGDAAISMSVNVNIPETPEERLEYFGLPAVDSQAMAKFTIKIQDKIRAAIKAGVTQEALQAEMTNYKMDTVSPRAKADPKTKVLTGFDALSDDEKREILADLKKKLGK